MSDLTIREAILADVPALQTLYLQHLTQYPSAEPQDPARWAALLARLIRDDHYHLLVGTRGDAVVSSVTLVVIENLTHNLRPYAVMENVVTHADHRGQGYASALIAHVADIARACGCYKIMLMTGSKRESTLQFYERCGFSRHEKTAFLMRL